LSFLLVLLALATASLGALGGLGGAVILVPLLVLTGTPAREAAPLGLLSVASRSMAAGPWQLAELTVHHRLGVTSETLAAAGASLRGRDEVHAVATEEGDGDLGEQRTSAAALPVFAGHGRINLAHAGPIIAGSLLGGQLGARLQARLDPTVLRRALAAVLVVVAAILFVQA